MHEQLPFGSDLEARNGESLSGGQGVNVVLPGSSTSVRDGSWRDGRHQPGGFRETDRQPERALWIARQKASASAALGEVFKATKVVVVAHYSGLTVAQMQNLRRQMKQAGASVKVAKNRLAKIALEGSDVASIGPF